MAYRMLVDNIILECVDAIQDAYCMLPEFRVQSFTINTKKGLIDLCGVPDCVISKPKLDILILI
jgi:hypothetical protein